MEKQMLIEIEKRNNDEIRKVNAKEVEKQFIEMIKFMQFRFLQEGERKKREDFEKLLIENEWKLIEAEKRLVNYFEKNFKLIKILFEANEADALPSYTDIRHFQTVWNIIDTERK